MKRFFAAVLVLIFVLTGCVMLAPGAPESLKSGNEIYKTGFYGTLFPKNYKYTGASVQIDDLVLSKIEHDRFTLYHADIGSYSEGTIYCAQEDFEEALAYYQNPENYSYYCNLKNKGKLLEIPQVDPDMFESLLSFAERSGYDPFNSRHNAQIEKEEFPMPDGKQVRFVFYKESADRLFASSRGTEYYILEDHLYAVYQYDFGHGEYEKLIAVKVPDDLSDYFIELVKPYV